ncbi:hypothetical protein Emag_005866 [Eimeria magna]
MAASCTIYKHAPRSGKTSQCICHLLALPLSRFYGESSNCVLVGARFTVVQDGSRMNRIDSCHDSNAAPKTRVVDSLLGNKRCLLSSPQPVSAMRLYGRQQKLQIHTPR